MLVTPDGQKAPPQDILLRLRKLDANLSIFWLPDFTSPDVRVDGRGRWAIAYKWKPTDRRHAYIQRGELDPTKDFDIVCFLPPDCSVDEAEGYLLRGCQSGATEDVAKLLETLHAERMEQRNRNWQPVVDATMEHIEANVIRPNVPFSAGGL